MRATIKIQMDNAAFGEFSEGELARILENLAAKVNTWGAVDQALSDLNGNRVGELKIYGGPKR